MARPKRLSGNTQESKDDVLIHLDNAKTQLHIALAILNQSIGKSDIITRKVKTLTVNTQASIDEVATKEVI